MGKNKPRHNPDKPQNKTGGECYYYEGYDGNYWCERGYVAHFKSPQEAAWFIPIICGKYNARQVFIEVNGFGIAVYDHLLSNGEKLDNIDVIPMRCTSMRL